MVFIIYRNSLLAEIESLQQKFQKVCQDLNEEKSLHIRAESRIRSLETELQTCADNMAILQSQLDDYCNLGEERSQQVSVKFQWIKYFVSCADGDDVCISHVR
jgi:chromosome segregation ATPase